MSKRRKKNSTNPRRDKLREARREYRAAAALAERDPSHENLATAFALGAAVKMIEGLIGDE